MKAGNLLRKTGKKLWIIVASEKNENELGLDEMMQNRILFLPKPYDSEVLMMMVNQIVEWKAEEKKGPTDFMRRFLAHFLGKQA